MSRRSRSLKPDSIASGALRSRSPPRAVERRVVAKRRRGDACRLSGAERERAGDRDARRALRRGREDERAVGQRERERGEEQRRRADGDQLVDAELAGRARTRSRTCRRSSRRSRSRTAAPRCVPTASSSRDAIRTAIGVTIASTTLGGPKRMTDATSGFARGPGSQPLDEVEHPLVDERHGEHERAPEEDDADEQPRRRDPVGEDAARPVADREPGQDDADQRAPDEERVAERRREDAARGELEAEQDGAGDEGRERQRRPARSHPAHPTQAARVLATRRHKRRASHLRERERAVPARRDEEVLAVRRREHGVEALAARARRERDLAARAARRPSRGGCGGSRRSTG